MTPAAVLFDRDGTLIVDVPYNRDPGAVVLVPGARRAVERVRAAGLPVGLVTNQSAVGLGLASMADVEACHRRLESLLGPFDVVAVCPHRRDEACACRKPEPGLVVQAAAALGVEPAACAVIGDIGTDVEAAERAGGSGVLVPTDATRPQELEAACHVAATLGDAVELVLSWR